MQAFREPPLVQHDRLSDLDERGAEKNRENEREYTSSKDFNNWNTSEIQRGDSNRCRENVFWEICRTLPRKEERRTDYVSRPNGVRVSIFLTCERCNGSLSSVSNCLRAC